MQSKPVLIFDGECGFCRKWIDRWQAITGSELDYIAYQELKGRFPGISRANLEQAIHLVQPSGEISIGAEAVVRTLALNSRYHWAFSFYTKAPGARFALDLGYRWVARNRMFFSKITRWL